MPKPSVAKGDAIVLSVVAASRGGMDPLGRRLDAHSRQVLLACAPAMIAGRTDAARTIDTGSAILRRCRSSKPVLDTIDNRIERLHDCMRELVRSPSPARDPGQAARRHAPERLSSERPGADWHAALRQRTRHGRQLRRRARRTA